MVFWEEFPCSEICALFGNKFAHKKGTFPPNYPHPAKKICPDQGNFSQLKDMDPSQIL